MAGTPIAPQVLSDRGITPAYNAAAAANSFINRGNMLVHIKNGSGASVNATLVTTAVVDGVVVANQVIAIAAGAEKIIGPFPPGVFNFSDGTMEIDLSATATVTIAAYVVPA